MNCSSRRQFTTGLIGLSPKSEQPVQGGFAFESPEQGLGLGHRLRDRAPFRTPRERRRISAVVVGGGIAGLSAAWRFHKRGFHDFIVLEMEKQAGGNARSGANEVSPYPWAAHYLPVPDVRQMLTRELCTELGLLDGHGWTERHLCHSPQERLFIHGRWQEGIEPTIGLTPSDVRQFRTFFEEVSDIRGTGAFRIPMEDGFAHAAPAIRALDRTTFDDWLRARGLYSPYLRWFLDYSTRDDYATRLDAISAWAGLHYFAAREPEDKGPLTWPEGNGWIVKRLLERLGRYVRTSAMVHHISRQGARWLVFTPDTLYETPSVIFAAPTWLAAWIVDPPPPRWPFEYVPWVTANLTLRRWPRNTGAEYAWDNVIFRSPSLGYVIATHQNVNTYQPQTVWTWYMALADGRAADQRRLLLGGDYHYWKERILADLERPHPDIRGSVSRIDIFRIGHAMPRPAPGAIFHPERVRRARPSGSLVYANCDLSALSLFEEALHRGAAGAAHVLNLHSRSGA